MKKMKKTKRTLAVFAAVMILLTGMVSVSAQTKIMTASINGYGGMAGYIDTQTSPTVKMLTSFQFNNDNARPLVRLSKFSGTTTNVYTTHYGTAGATSCGYTYTPGYKSGDSLYGMHGITGGTKYKGDSYVHKMIVE